MKVLSQQNGQTHIMLHAVRLITQLKTKYGVSDDAIGYECEVSREHITRVRTGKRQASEELTAKLQNLLDYCKEINYQPERKPYTWKKKPAPRAAVLPERRLPTHQPAPRVQREHQVAPRVQPAPKHQKCEACQKAGARFYPVLGGWYCDQCAKSYGQNPPR